MKFVVLLIFINVGFVLGASKICENPGTVTLYASEIVSEELSENNGHKISKKSIADHPTPVENNENHDEAVQEPCRLSLPFLNGLSSAGIPQEPYVDDRVQDFMLPMNVIPPKVSSLPFNKWTPYDLDYLSQEPVHDYRSYNDYNMPYTFPSPMPLVRSLPPVISTHIHETIPDVEEGYALDGFPDNEIYFPPYVRSVRSRDDDFLAQLRKDATIPNILPTMPFPYMRSSPPIYQHSQERPMVAMFPAESGSNCALPFLVSCTPTISQGTLTHNTYERIPMHLPSDVGQSSG